MMHLKNPDGTFPHKLSGWSFFVKRQSLKFLKHIANA